MLTPRLFTIAREGSGQLSTMAAPRGGDWLSDEMRGLRVLGVHVVVSLLTASEGLELGLEDEPSCARDAGLRFDAMPTPDRDTPDPAATRVMVRRLLDDLAAGRSVAIHCRAGIGRSSLLAAAVLKGEGTPAADAWQLIAAARGLPVPDTDAQIEFVSAFSMQADKARTRAGQVSPSWFSPSG